MDLNIVEMRENFKETHSTFTTSDGITLFLREWTPTEDQSKETAVLILHGITAHSGPYGFLGLQLASMGFHTFGLDLRGHGLSDGNRGDYPSRERLVLDLCEALAYIKKTHPKVVILGHSLGVLQSMLIMKNCLGQIHGAVLLSGARAMKPSTSLSFSFSQKLKIVLSSILAPGKPAVSYYREGMTGLDDPLFNFRYTLRFIRLVDSKSLQFPGDLGIPIFVGVGDQDELFSIESVRELYDEIPAKEKEFYVQPGAKHAVFPEGSFKPLMSWLDNRFP
ncbi:MAG: alpha/beta hydrolase [Candidatus Thorarchaeota archaeon]